MVADFQVFTEDTQTSTCQHDHCGSPHRHRLSPSHRYFVDCKCLRFSNTVGHRTLLLLATHNLGTLLTLLMYKAVYRRSVQQSASDLPLNAQAHDQPLAWS